MNIFSIFKKRKKAIQDLTPAAILRLTYEYVPEIYKDSERFIESKDFLNNNVWGLALETLLELSEDSEHDFSADFWLNLATCADKMQMPQQAEFCRKQITGYNKDANNQNV